MNVLVKVCFLLFCAGISGAHGRSLESNIKIIGGQPAYPGEFPWVAFIRFTQSLPGLPDGLCVGSIRSATQIITAAHCVLEAGPQDILVVAGAYNITFREQTQQIKKVLKITIHPEYYSYEGTTRNDIAILEIEPLTFTSFVAGIRLPPPGHQPKGMCWITGWGQTETEQMSDVLLKAEVPIVPNDECYRIYPDYFMSTIQVCAGHDAGGYDACMLDTGGPLLCNDLVEHGKNVEYFAGIVSWGFYCALPQKPGVYTKVSRYIDWI